MAARGAVSNSKAGDTLSRADRPAFWISVLRWSAASVNSWVHFLPLLLASPFSRRAAWAIYLNWGRKANRIFGVTLSLRDDDNGNPGPKPHLYVALNQSNLAEPVYLAQLLPPLYIVVSLKHSLLPLLGWAMPLLRYAVIVPQWKTQAKRGIERAAARLARGESWAISLEGARSADGGLLQYRKGPVVMAIQSQATIIPFALHGAHEVLPRGEWRVRPGHVELHLLPAIPTRGLSYKDRDAVMSQLHALAEREFTSARTEWPA